MEIGQIRGSSSFSPAAKGARKAPGRDGARIHPDQARPDQLDIRGAARDVQAVQRRASVGLLDSDAERARRLHEVKTRLLSGELERQDVFLETARIILSAGSEGFLDTWLP